MRSSRNRRADSNPELQNQLAQLSDELLANVLIAADSPGVIFKTLQVNKHMKQVLLDESWATWSGLARRMSTYVHTMGETGLSSIVTKMLSRAALRIGGWRTLCAEKEAYYAAKEVLPTNAPTDWPSGRWYPLTPHEELGLFDTLLYSPPQGKDIPNLSNAASASPSLAAKLEPLSLVFLLDGSGSMTPCFRGITRFIRNMILHLRRGYDSSNVPADAHHLRNATASLLQFNDYKVRQDFGQERKNVPLFSEDMDTILSSWEDIRKLGGTTRFVHAVEAAKSAVDAAPELNRKLLVLVTDGVAEDWETAVQTMLQMQKDCENFTFVVLGVAACSYYEDEFPVNETLKLLGEKHKQQLFMLSRDNTRPRELHLDSMTPG